MKFGKFSLEQGWICSDRVEQIGSADPQRAACPRNRKPAGEPGSPDPTAPEQISQAPGLREFRLAESQQIPADSTPSRASPTGRRIGGYDYKTESFQRPHVEHYTRFREMKNSNFFGAPPLGVGVFGKLPAARKRKDRQRNRLGRSQQAPASPRN